MLNVPSLSQQEANVFEMVGQTMGTFYKVRLAIGTNKPLDDVLNAVHLAVSKVDADMSTYRDTSALCRFNRAAVNEWVPVTQDIVKVYREAQRVSKLTQGAFNVSVLDIVKAWGFGPTKGASDKVGLLERKNTTKTPDGDAIDYLTAPPCLKKNDRLRIDFSGIAKGFGVDEIARVLEKYKIENYLIEIAGELRASGRKNDGTPWIVGLELPLPDRLVMYDRMPIFNSAVATSGGYRNFVTVGEKNYSHTIDPRTGQPVDNDILSTTVLASTCMEADALATGLTALGHKNALALCNAHKIAAMFIQETDGGFLETKTNAFYEAYPSG